jgi:hypothetical protein
MIDQRTIFEIHRLAHEGLSVRKIAATLGISRQTTSKYLDDPTPPRPRRPRPSQLEPFQDAITHMSETDPKVSAVVLRQRLAEQGFLGGLLCGSISPVCVLLAPRSVRSSVSNPPRAPNARLTGAISAPWPMALPHANSTASP